MKYLIPILILLGITVWSLKPGAKPVIETAPTSDIVLGAELPHIDYDCTKKDTKVDVKNLNGKTLYACVFSQEKPDTKVFPDDMTGVTFICSHLDNVIVGVGNTIIDNNGTCGSRKRFKAQADGEDWLIDAQSKPVEPINKETLLEKGLNIDPTKIPKK